MEKQERQRRHLKRRAFERYGILLSDIEIEEAISKVTEGEVPFVDEHREDGKSCCLLEIQGLKAVWVYDKNTKQLVSVFSIAMFGGATKKRARKAAKKRLREKKKENRRYKSLKM